MTRDEAKKVAVTNGKIASHNGKMIPIYYSDMKNRLVDKIYDAFESKTCHTCNKYINHGFGWVECDLIPKEACVDIDYCSEWEKKDAK